jgi:hypothetical protein
MVQILGCASLSVSPKRMQEAKASAAKQGHQPVFSLERFDFKSGDTPGHDRWLSFGDREAFEARFLEYVEDELQQTKAELFQPLAQSALLPPRIRLRIELSSDIEDYRTGILELLYSQPVSPYWGTINARNKVWVRIGDKEFLISDHEIKREFSVIFYSWVRVSEVEAIVAKVYGNLFQKSAQAVAARMPDLVALAYGQQATPLRPLSDPELSELKSRFDLAAGRLLKAPPATEKLFQRETGFRVMRAPPESAAGLVDVRVGLVDVRAEVSARESLLSKYLGSLGGVEVGSRRGIASVTSRARNSAGFIETLGTGDATTEGFRVALYKPPGQAQYFFPPSFGFLSQKISIAGFEQELPMVKVPGSNDIAGVLTDPSTGEVSDLVLQPIAYELDLKSVYLGQGFGLDFVFGFDQVRFFFTGQVALNLVEARHVDIQIHTSRKSGYSLELGKSFISSGQFGVYFPDLHLALRISGEFEFYRDFEFPEPVDLLASARFNPEKRIFERERIFVEGASLVQLNGQLSAVVMF